MNEPTPAASSSTSVSSASSQPPVGKFRPLRIWPALFLVALMFITRFGPGFLEGGMGVYWMIGVFGPLLCCLLMLIWWLAASRATWKERLLGFLGLVGGLVLIQLLVHPTMRGPGTTYLTLPMGMVFFALAAAVLREKPPVRRTGLAVLLAVGGFGFSL